MSGFWWFQPSSKMKWNGIITPVAMLCIVMSCYVSTLASLWDFMIEYFDQNHWTSLNKSLGIPQVQVDATRKTWAKLLEPPLNHLHGQRIQRKLLCSVDLILSELFCRWNLALRNLAASGKAKLLHPNIKKKGPGHFRSWSIRRNASNISSGQQQSQEHPQFPNSTELCKPFGHCMTRSR